MASTLPPSVVTACVLRSVLSACPPLTFYPQEEQILSFLLHATEDDEPEWLAAAVIGTCKLLLTGLVMNEEVSKVFAHSTRC